MSLSPIAAFVFRRPDHTRRMLNSLLANPESLESEVVVFADGPRSERDIEAVAQTREVVRSAGLPNLRIVEREENMGLARSVVAGVTELCNARGSVIVLEDDLLLAPTFLKFMNAALDRYRERAEVFAVSGYMFPIVPPSSADAVFLPFTASWGWATWDRAWRTLRPAGESHAILSRSRALRTRFDLDGSYPYWAMLEALLAGKVDSWAIRWYASVFLRQGLVLFPSQSLVANTGFDGTGVHSGSAKVRAASARALAFTPTRLPDVIRTDERAYQRVKRLLRRDTGRLNRLIRSVAGRLSRLLHGLAAARGRDS